MRKIIIVLILVCGGSWAMCQENDSVRKNSKIKSELIDWTRINPEDWDKLGAYIHHKDGFPVLTIDSLDAVNKLHISPYTFYVRKTGLEWKKNYPVKDFLLLRSHVKGNNHELIVAIDSITAVFKLKIHP